MKFNPESQNITSDESFELTPESAILEVGENISLSEYFDDGFGDDLPDTVELKSNEDIEAFKKAYNIDLN